MTKRHIAVKTQFIQSMTADCLRPSVKYRNGGCSGLEPDFLFIYSAYNFSNRIFCVFIFHRESYHVCVTNARKKYLIISRAGLTLRMRVNIMK